MSLSNFDWQILFERIEARRCTCFLGAGVNAGLLSTAPEIAAEWAREEGYPFEPSTDLLRVAQFLAIKYDASLPKMRMQRLLKEGIRNGRPELALRDPSHPLNVLARLPLRTYITTNYDDLVTRALKEQERDPKVEICRWNNTLQNSEDDFRVPPAWVPTDSEPHVYHLHGHFAFEESMVLTEDDYIDFLVNSSKRNDLLTSRIERALTSTSLMFIGYRLADWNFRVLFRRLMQQLESGLRKMSIAVQLKPEDIARDREEPALEFLEDYFRKIEVRVYWGDVNEFAQELIRRHDEFTIPANPTDD